MTIKVIKTGDIMDMEEGLAVRMVEQGKAVVYLEEAAPETAKKSAKAKKDVTADEPENKD